MNLSKLGIVILNYNTYIVVIQCIRSILKYYGQNIKIIVVDNKSSNESLSILSDHYKTDHNIEVISSYYNGGYSYGNNIGINYLVKNFPEIKYLAIINPDTTIIDGYIFQDLISSLDNDDSLAGIAPLMIINGYLKPERWAIRMPRYINNFLSSFVCLKSLNPLLYKTYEINPDNLVAYVDVLPGSFFIMKKDIFFQIGLFNEKIFLYGEEIVIANKIKKENLKLGLLFSSYYVHNHQTSKKNIIQEVKHLSYSTKSHLYYNKNCNTRFWGTIDTLLLLLFLPLRAVEIFTIHLLIKMKARIN